MSIKYLILLISLCISVPVFGQKEKMSREDKDEKNQARLERINLKNDVALFRRQILGLREYAAEKQKAPAVQKITKMPTKVTAVVDTDATDNGMDSKTLTGYIRQDAGDNSTNMYELIFDRSQRKIVSVNKTQEGIDADRDMADEKAENTGTKKAVVKKTTVKKTKDDDDDDDADEDKPSKTKQKDEDDE